MKMPGKRAPNKLISSKSPKHTQTCLELPLTIRAQSRDSRKLLDYQDFDGETVSILMSDDESFQEPSDPRFSHCPMADTASRNSRAKTPIMAYSPNF